MLLKDLTPGDLFIFDYDGEAGVATISVDARVFLGRSSELCKTTKIPESMDVYWHCAPEINPYLKTTIIPELYCNLGHWEVTRLE